MADPKKEPFDPFLRGSWREEHDNEQSKNSDPEVDNHAARKAEEVPEQTPRFDPLARRNPEPVPNPQVVVEAGSSHETGSLPSVPSGRASGVISHNVSRPAEDPAEVEGSPDGGETTDPLTPARVHGGEPASLNGKAKVGTQAAPSPIQSSDPEAEPAPSHTPETGGPDPEPAPENGSGEQSHVQAVPDRGKASGKAHMIALRMDRSQIELLNGVCQGLGMSKSEFIRAAVREKIKSL